MLAPWIRGPVFAVPVLGASFAGAGLAERREYDGDVEGFATVTGTWTGSEVRARHQVPAAARDQEDLPVYWDRPPRALRFPWSEQEGQQVRDHLLERGFGWNIYSLDGGGRDHVTARLTRVLPEIAAWAGCVMPLLSPLLSATFLSVDTCIAFSVVWIGPRAGVIATRPSGFVRLAREVVRRDGFHVGSQGPLPDLGSSRPGRRVWARWRIASSR